MTIKLDQSVIEQELLPKAEKIMDQLFTTDKLSELQTSVFFGECLLPQVIVEYVLNKYETIPTEIQVPGLLITIYIKDSNTKELKGVVFSVHHHEQD